VVNNEVDMLHANIYYNLLILVGWHGQLIG
jgi:hypothetical protein